MKALRYILVWLLASAVIGLLCYEGYVRKDLDTGDLVKAGTILLGLIAACIKTKKQNKVVNKKAVYQKAYSEFIQNAFYDNPKLEKQFYNAVHNYNQNKPSAALAKLEKLRRSCQRSADLYAVTAFQAFCSDDATLYANAIIYYESALSMRPNATLASNMGLCHQRLGDFEKAEKAYLYSIQLKPDNAYAYTNLSAMYFRSAEYDAALEYAENALKINATMPQALSTAAMCCALMEDEEGYNRYYRQAVSNGYDGKKIKDTIQQLMD